MEKTLKALFDYQRFAGNAALDALIQDTEAHYAGALSDEELFLVSAAGEPELTGETDAENKASPAGVWSPAN